MAHIISCMLEADEEDYILNLNNCIARAVATGSDSLDGVLGRESPAPSVASATSAISTEKPWQWRMMHPPPERKYQLFPKDKSTTRTASPASKTLDPEQAFAVAMGQTGDKGGDKVAASNGLRIRVKDQNFSRRRKASVPELGPMTTVQEAAMDSPTIPGRPPLHERSVSAPGKQEPTMSRETRSADQLNFWKAADHLDFWKTADDVIDAADVPSTETGSRQSSSPRKLAPLMIPEQSSLAPRMVHVKSRRELRNGSVSESPVRKRNDEQSPRIAPKNPFTPLSASVPTTSSLVSAVLGPYSAPIESRGSPRSWEKPPTNFTAVTLPSTAVASAKDTDSPTRATSAEPFSAPVGFDLTNAQARSGKGHRRYQSESGSIMERGRPRKRNETTVGRTALAWRSESKRDKSAERRAFEHLPKGWKASEAVSVLSQVELTLLQKQGAQKAARFEVLKKEDVDNLSTELRQLDERTDYLRRTYTSLRAGRRNLHTRICQYLRSPRTAKFTYESMLKQEEALAELDTSIDDWVTKLEQAENRRTRVREKLLEHVAAAATIPQFAAVTSPSALQSPTPAGDASEGLQFALGMPISPMTAAAIAAVSTSTPPCSPLKSVFQPPPHSPPPHSPPPAPHQVPPIILEQPLAEDETDIASPAVLSVSPAPTASCSVPPPPATPDFAAPPPTMSTTVDSGEEAAASPAPTSPAPGPTSDLRRAEIIRIYADNDVYDLIAEVENEMNKIDRLRRRGSDDKEDGVNGYGSPVARSTSLRRNEAGGTVGLKFIPPPSVRWGGAMAARTDMHRQRTQDALTGAASPPRGKKPQQQQGAAVAFATTTAFSPPPTSTPPSPTLPGAVAGHTEELFLTPAVFRSDRSVMAS